MHLYDKELRFLETRRFDLSTSVSRPFLRGIFADGTWLVLAYEGGGRISGPPGSVIESRFSLLHYDTSGALIDSLGTFDGAKRYSHEFNGIIHFPYIPLTTSPLEGVAGNSLVVLRGDKPELEYYDLSGKLTRVATWQRERVRSADITDYVLGRSLDSLGVERVEIYGLRARR